MTLRPRFILQTATILSVFALALATVPARAQAPTLVRRHPVGWDRIPRLTLPGPVAAGDGAVFVPRALAEVPTMELDNIVADETAMGIHDRPTFPAHSFRSAEPDKVSSVSANVRANDTTLDPPGIANSETSIAVLGTNMVAGWNDGKNFGISPGATGWAYSTNGGLSWTDGGVLPAPSATAIHEGDPVVTNDNAGNFYFSDLYTPDNDVTSAIAVCKGNFSGGSFSWNMPVMVASTVSDFLDKEWLCADKVNGIVYCSWTRFRSTGGNQIEFSRSTTNGATWDPVQVLTLTAVESVQGSRIAVGPNHEVQVIYFVYDKATGNNYMRARRSTTLGTSWGPEITLPTGPNGIFSNYGSGAPGFNRAGGVGFPSLAIDHTTGANSGRIYATWEETVNFYFDPLGSVGSMLETEANDTPAGANPIVVGQAVNGSLSSTSDQDWFSFAGTAGQTVILYLVPGSPTAGDAFIRLYSGGGGTANRAALSYIGYGTGLIVYTLPYTGTFYFRTLANSASLGNYVVYTGVDLPDPGDQVARDTRDCIIQSSIDGLSWDSRRIVNDDPPLYDNSFPEVAVDAAGQVFVDWYDHRGDILGIGTDIYYARSPNGSVSFLPSAKVNDGPSVNWNLVASNLAPNMGDYSALVADGCNVYANFADGRQGTPDSWVATINDCATPTLISLMNAQAQPDHVDLAWYAADGASVTATVYRREQDTEWTAIGTIVTDGFSQLSFRDGAVQAGARYGYRVGVVGTTGTEFFGEVWVSIPSDLRLAIRSTSNPSTDGLTISFTLPHNERATIEVLDVNGRSVESVEVAASGQVRLGSTLKSGVYMIRLLQGGQRALTKAVVVN